MPRCKSASCGHPHAPKVNVARKAHILTTPHAQQRWLHPDTPPTLITASSQLHIGQEKTHAKLEGIRQKLEEHIRKEKKKAYMEHKESLLKDMYSVA